MYHGLWSGLNALTIRNLTNIPAILGPLSFVRPVSYNLVCVSPAEKRWIGPNLFFFPQVVARILAFVFRRGEDLGLRVGSRRARSPERRQLAPFILPVAAGFAEAVLVKNGKLLSEWSDSVNFVKRCRVCTSTDETWSFFFPSSSSTR